MVRIEEVPELQVPEFVFAAEQQRKNAAEYAVRLREIRRENAKDKRLADMANVCCFFGGMGLMGFIMAAAMRWAGLI